jgi:hypothetical protein
MSVLMETFKSATVRSKKSQPFALYPNDNETRHTTSPLRTLKIPLGGPRTRHRCSRRHTEVPGMRVIR